MKRLSQKERIRKHLDRGWKLSRIKAWEKLGVWESPARISELRSDGYPVITQMVSVKNRYGDRVRVAEWRKVRG